jgi:hypothetical protein
LVQNCKTLDMGLNRLAARRREMMVGPLEEGERREGEKPKEERREWLERKRVKVEREKAVWRREVRRRMRTWAWA